jgi:hypothetical protein
MPGDAAAKPEEDRRVVCRSCKASTWHEVLRSFKVHNHEEEGESPGHIAYMVLRCRGCNSDISFGMETYDAYEQYQHQQNSPPWEEYSPPIVLYPNRMEGRPPIAYSEHLPQQVRSIYTEAHAALCSNLPVLAGVGLRGIVETVCKDQKAKGRNLEKKIHSLKKLGLIPASGATVLHSLRFMGNKAAHEATAHTVEELQRAFEVVEYLLSGVYIIPKRAESLPKPKGKGPPETPPPPEADINLDDIPF